MPVYNLVVNNGGPKLKESPADARFNFVTSSLGRFGIRIVATHMTVQQLTDHQLSGYTDRPIFDKRPRRSLRFHSRVHRRKCTFGSRARS